MKNKQNKKLSFWIQALLRRKSDLFRGFQLICSAEWALISYECFWDLNLLSSYSRYKHNYELFYQYVTTNSIQSLCHPRFKSQSSCQLLISRLNIARHVFDWGLCPNLLISSNQEKKGRLEIRNSITSAKRRQCYPKVRRNWESAWKR